MSEISRSPETNEINTAGGGVEKSEVSSEVKSLNDSELEAKKSPEGGEDGKSLGKTEGDDKVESTADKKSDVDNGKENGKPDELPSSKKELSYDPSDAAAKPEPIKITHPDEMDLKPCSLEDKPDEEDGLEVETAEEAVDSENGEGAEDDEPLDIFNDEEGEDYKGSSENEKGESEDKSFGDKVKNKARGVALGYHMKEALTAHDKGYKTAHAFREDMKGQMLVSAGKGLVGVIKNESIADKTNSFLTSNEQKAEKASVYESLKDGSEGNDFKKPYYSTEDYIRGKITDQAHEIDDLYSALHPEEVIDFSATPITKDEIESHSIKVDYDPYNTEIDLPDLVEKDNKD
ncbi:MAG: hypothetical protein IJV67_04470 [Clostridia bacterium]|nr:hypothetical protein [Clostridia bacterium]